MATPEESRLPGVGLSAPAASRRRAAAPVPGLSLKRNFQWTLAGNSFYAGCQWAIVIVLARLGSPQMVGQYALAVAIVAPLMVVANLGLRTVLASDVESQRHFADYLALRLVILVLVFVAAAGIVIGLRYRAETATLILLVTLSMSFDSISDVIYGLLQQRERMDRIALSRSAQGGLQIVTFGLVLYLTHSLLCGVVGLAAVSALVTLGYDGRSARMVLRSGEAIAGGGPAGHHALRPRWDRDRVWGLLRLSLPLGVAAVLGSVETNLPRYFIERQLGEHALGIFAAIAQLPNIGNILVNAMGQSVYPRLAIYNASRQYHAYTLLVVRLLVVIGLLDTIAVLGALTVGKGLLSLTFGPVYAMNDDVLVVQTIAAGTMFVATLLGVAVTAMRQFAVQVPIHAVALVIFYIANRYLVSSYGLVGAASAVLVNALALVLMFGIAWSWSLRTARARGLVCNDCGESPFASL